MRRSGAEGPVGRAIGSVMHVRLQGQEGMHVELQSQMVAADVNFFSGAAGPVGRTMGSAMHVGLQGQEGMYVELQSQMVAADVKLFSGAAGPVGRAMGSAMHVGLQGQEGMHVELQSQMVAADVIFSFGCCRASGQDDGLCDACGNAGTGRYACGTAVTNGGGRGRFFSGAQGPVGRVIGSALHVGL